MIQPILIQISADPTFFSAGFWTFATALLAACTGAAGYLIQRSHTLKDKQVDRREVEAIDLNSKYISKIEEAATLKAKLNVERQTRKLVEEKYADAMAALKRQESG